MNTLSAEQAASREKTLRIALLLSVWGPLATGIAMVMSHSTTQMADFVRRSVELLALFTSWFVFHRLIRGKESTLAQRATLEKLAGLSVAIAMGCSGAITLAVTLSRLSTHQPGGNVYLGLVIAVLGLIVNTWFWRRYWRLDHELHTTIIRAQCHLYRAKSFVDICVIAALATVAVAPAHAVTRYIDLLGSIAVAIYLLWSSANAWREAMTEPGTATPDADPLLNL
jgi:divalent metal cation (Fe/Co/Zn/Cd) transporter